MTTGEKKNILIIFSLRKKAKSLNNGHPFLSTIATMLQIFLCSFLCWQRKLALLSITTIKNPRKPFHFSLSTKINQNYIFFFKLCKILTFTHLGDKKVLTLI